ncbi:hypothetical protein AJ80_04662 [Polytolypa hystricis UAMH7299]|uniref:Uncharacterized protein n=1 Tax=Polytolypa hystricis (strain UAMH7299) TaxID=1447883 RepID=A0A2B7Y9S0_POLH7|nr:hypothetical protein AJ80_04662 [Polytolypa hystricis UAMH7299]
MTFLAPYTNLMRLGQGFNSYTQQICIDDAVLIRTSSDEPHSPSVPGIPGHFPQHSSEVGEEGDPKPSSRASSPSPMQFTGPGSSYRVCLGSNMNQTVTYTAHAIDNLADVADALNISSSATIHYSTTQSNGTASFVRENNISESDINFIVSVKVINELPVSSSSMEFRPIEGLNPDNFPSIYGDCFIAGFLEGGEFSAIVSIKVQDKAKISKVKLAAEMQLAVGNYFKPFNSGGITDKEHADLWSDTEVNISVNWSGGGNVKPKDSWDLQTIIQAANDFPSQVSKFSQKISAILMSYNSLRSFHELNATLTTPLVVLDYRLCELYTADLLATFLAYKSIWKSILKMFKAPHLYAVKESTPAFPEVIQLDPVSLNHALLECRKGMTLILQETKLLAKQPHLGIVNEDGTLRQLKCQQPSELNARLPMRIESKKGSSKAGIVGNSSPDGITGTGSYMPDPSFGFPRITSPGGGVLPRVGDTFYMNTNNSPDDQTPVENPLAQNVNATKEPKRSRSCGVFPLLNGFRYVTSLFTFSALPKWIRRTDQAQVRMQESVQVLQQVTGRGGGSTVMSGALAQGPGA